MKKLKPVHPGKVLLEEFLKPMDLSQNRLALAIGVAPRRINEIVLGREALQRIPRSDWGAIHTQPCQTCLSLLTFSPH